MNKKPIVLFDIDYTLFNTHEFKNSQFKNYNSYGEVIDVLEKLSNFASLGIFSKGDPNFQKIKLIKTKIDKFFKKKYIHIFDDKDANLTDVLERYKSSKLFLIDDKLTILYSAKKHFPEITAVWVKRGPYAQNQENISGFKPDAEIENLSEVVEIVQKRC